MVCLFCDLIANADAQAKHVCEMKHGVVFLHPDQAFRGRCLYVYRRHVEDFLALDADSFSAFARELHEVSAAIMRALQPQLINVAILGNQVRHLHWHVIPRYTGDANGDNPPWPHDTRELTDEEYARIRLAIRLQLEGPQCRTE